MFTIFLQVIIVYAISSASWKLLRQFIVKSTLDNLPGPPSQSFLFGYLFLILSPYKGLLIVCPISRCFSTDFQPQRMGISQTDCRKMYEHLSIPHEDDNDAP